MQGVSPPSSSASPEQQRSNGSTDSDNCVNGSSASTHHLRVPLRASDEGERPGMPWREASAVSRCSSASWSNARVGSSLAFKEYACDPLREPSGWRCCGCLEGLKRGAGPRLPSVPLPPGETGFATTEQEFRQRMAFLEEVPLFKRLPYSQYPLLARVLRTRTWEPGTVIIGHGVISSEFFLIAKGNATIRMDDGDGGPFGGSDEVDNDLDEEVPTFMMRQGDYFGEKGLERGGAARTSPATIVAGEGLVTLSLAAEEFEECGLRKNLRFPRRQAMRGIAETIHRTVSAGGIERKKSMAAIAKNEEDRAFINKAMMSNYNFRSLVDLSKEELVQQIVDTMEEENVPEGLELSKLGELGGMFYVVKTGSFELRIDALPPKWENREGTGVLPQRYPSGLDRDSRGGGSGQSWSVESLVSVTQQRSRRKQRFLQELLHSRDMEKIPSNGLSSSSRDGHRRESEPGRTSSPTFIPTSSQECPDEALGGGGGGNTKRKTAPLSLGFGFDGEEGPSNDFSSCIPTPVSRIQGKKSRDMDLLDFKTDSLEESSEMADEEVLQRSGSIGSMTPRTLREGEDTVSDTLPSKLSLASRPSFQKRNSLSKGYSSGSLGGGSSSAVGDGAQTPADRFRGTSHTAFDRDTTKRWRFRSECLDGSDESRLGNGLAPADEEAEEDAGTRNLVLGARRAGDSFGEMALLYNAPQSSTAVACEDSVVWRIGQGAFTRIMNKNQERKVQHIVDHLNHVDLLTALLSHEKQELAKHFLATSFKQGDIVVTEGERVNAWYIVVEGSCTMQHTEGQKQVQLSTLRTYQYFGERALLRDVPQEFTVQVLSQEGLKCLVLNGPMFKELSSLLQNDPSFRHAMEDDLKTFSKFKRGPNSKLASLGARMKASSSQVWDTQSSECLAQENSQKCAENDEEVTLDSLDRVGTLGMGAFGIVTLEKDVRTGRTYALKACSKGYVEENSMQHHLKSEREMLTMIDSPFIIKLFATFRDAEFVYFLLEPALGGELHTALHAHKDIFGLPSNCPFFISCIALALAHLHERNIVFRDLKPENVLLSKLGYPKICDFGFAKFVVGKTMTLCGTPDYVAPEVIEHMGYDRMIDWWALGVLTFELLAGYTPFGDTDEVEEIAGIFHNIRAGIDQVEFPEEFDASPSSRTFVQVLLQPRPAKRLGIGGLSEVKRHPFLAGIDFKALASCETPSPYRPDVVSDEDLRFFNTEDQEIPPCMSCLNADDDWDADF